MDYRHLYRALFFLLVFGIPLPWAELHGQGIKPMGLPAGSEGYRAYFRTDVVPPSPTAASLMAVSTVQNNLSTGAVSLSLPVFDASGEEISLPISLNYNYDGFKPYEQIGWVGLGWNLMAGGSISRIPFGHLDNSSAAGSNYDDDYIQERITNVNVEQEFLRSINEGLFDTEPDVFVYNFNGQSGKFIKYKDKFYCLPTRKFRITGGDSGFVITTEDGTQYTFDAYETTSAKTTASDPYTLPTYKSTYYLSKIQSASGKETVSFQYTSDGQLEQGGAKSQIYKKVEMPYASFTALMPVTFHFASKVNCLRLSSIITSKYNIRFIGRKIRQDLYYPGAANTRMLDEIQVSNANGQVVKYFRLNHDYFGTGESYSGKFLKLKSLDELQISFVADPQAVDTLKWLRHVFDYVSENSMFPHQGSANVDAQGYYTGRGDMSGTMVPRVFYPGGPDRSTALDGTKLGALERITYPEGGTTEISYEINSKKSGSNYLTESNGFFVEAGLPGELINPTLYNDRETFTLNEAQQVSFRISRRAIAPNGDNNTRNPTPDMILTQIVDGDLLLQRYSYTVGLESDGAGVLVTLALDPGVYEVRVQTDNKEKYVSCQTGYRTSTGIPIEGETVAGLRVKSLNIAPGNGPVIHKEYRYTDDKGFSTGVDGRPFFSRDGFTEIISDGLVDQKLQETLYGSSISQQTPFINPFYYKRITELQVSGTDTLKTQYYFKTYPDNYYLGVDQTTEINYKKTASGYVPVHKKEHMYQVKRDTFFFYMRPRQVRGVGGGLTGGAVTEPNLTFDYDRLTHEQVWKYLSSEREVSYEGTDSLVAVNQYFYQIPGHRNLVRQMTNTSDGRNRLLKFKYPGDYAQAVSGPFLAANLINVPLEEQEWNYSGTDSTLNSLKVTEYNSSALKPSRIYLFKGFGIKTLNNEGRVSGLYSHLLSDSRLEERAEITYNTDAQTVVQRYPGGPPVSYKYGYPGNTPSGIALMATAKNTEVTASCENALADEIFYENFEDSPEGINGEAHTGHGYKQGTYAVSWVPPNSRHYILDYWYLQSGIWTYKKQDYTGNVTLNMGTALDDVRIYPSDAKITTYSYEPGLGMSSKSEASGNTQHYHYDDFGRPESVKDMQGKVIETYDYHYKQP